MALFNKMWFLNILIILTFRQTITTNRIEERIVGGYPTTINEAKYMVSLRTQNGQFMCGGSLIKDQYVVTAAHCVKGKSFQDIMVHGGTTTLSQQGTKRAVKRISIPSDFSFSTYLNDVAVLKLTKPLTGTNIETIPLCSCPLPTRSWVEVFGWGYMDEHIEVISNELRAMDVRTISHRRSKKMLRFKFNLTQTMICAALLGKRDACQGDSGGPLVYEGKLCGIVSYGIGCARGNYPGIYTSINVVKGFVQNSTRY